MGGKIRDQYVIHVAPVVHDKDNGCFRVDGLDGFFVLIAKPHLVECVAQQPGQSNRKAEIGEGRKGWHDLTGIAARLLRGDSLGHTSFAGMLLNRLTDLRIINQLLNHVVSTRQLEGLDRALKALVQTCPPRAPASGGKTSGQTGTGNAMRK